MYSTIVEMSIAEGSFDASLLNGENIVRRDFHDPCSSARALLSHPSLMTFPVHRRFPGYKKSDLNTDMFLFAHYACNAP